MITINGLPFCCGHCELNWNTAICNRASQRPCWIQYGLSRDQWLNGIMQGNHLVLCEGQVGRSRPHWVNVPRSEVCIAMQQDVRGYPGYFQEPHWKSMGLPEISRVTGQTYIWCWTNCGQMDSLNTSFRGPFQYKDCLSSYSMWLPIKKEISL